jgi:hypothetical protein
VQIRKGQNASVLKDDAAGRLPDKLAEVGTGKITAAAPVKVVKLFNLDTSHVHRDTTSKIVYCDYEIYGSPGETHPLVITYGFGKDHRPDLKQPVHSLLSEDSGFPITPNMRRETNRTKPSIVICQLK